jgi:multicomponent Na+:H+ antiporter subunit D
MIGLLLGRRRSLQAVWTLGTMLAALASSSWLLAVVWRSGQPVVFQSGGWAAPFGISLIGDLLAAVFVVMSQLVLATGVLYAIGSKDSVVVLYAIGSKDSVVKYPTFYPLYLMLATSLSGAILT